MKKFLCLLLYIYTTANAYRYYIVPEDQLQHISKCPSQPCATINDLLNSTQFNMSNTEYYFLPGSHQLNVNMIITFVHNVSLTGSSSSSPGVLHCFGDAMLEISYSNNIIITNLVFEDCGAYRNGLKDFDPIFPCFSKEGYFTNLLVSSCSHVSITNISFWNHTGYGIVGISVTNVFYLENILLNVPQIMHSDMIRCNKGILACMKPKENLFHGNETSQILISKLVCNSNRDDLCSFASTMGLQILLYDSPFDVFVSINNSSFTGIRYLESPILSINIHTYRFRSTVFVKNCYLSSNKQITYFHKHKPAIQIEIPDYNATVAFHNVTFTSNSFTDLLISVTESYHLRTFSNDCVFVTNVSFVDLTFTDNTFTKLIYCEGNLQFSNCLVNVIISGFLNIYNTSNFFHDGLISIHKIAFHLYGAILISHNDGLNLGSIIYLYSSIMTVYNNITFLSNICRSVIDFKSLFPYIMIFENATIVFKSNNCYQLITAETEVNLYPFCLFQYFTKDGSIALDKSQLFNLQGRYNIVFIDNIQKEVSTKRKSAINYLTSHCQWLHGATFDGYDPGVINKHILNLGDSAKQGLILGHHINLCYCPRNGTYNCSVDLLGQAYPGQTLQVDMCAPYLTGNDISVMFVDTHNVKVENMACKIANLNQLTTTISRKHKTMKFTIVSNNSNEYCSLFVTAQPNLYRHYDVFHVQVLPCPIGFMLRNGICDCDPILIGSSLRIITCYINEIAIKRPANSWISHNINTSRYQISSHCPLDYCVPHTLKLKLAHPDSQCLFHRTGLLCSKCQTGLSMVFGSSRCIRCNNVYLFLTIAVLVAGVVLVLSLYWLHLTVTKGTINGMIFYANVISINYSVFLANSYTHQFIKTFISFANLDLGIETCFYNGMDSYAKMWLQLFFPFYLITLATLLILASRYSTRIQRLTFARSLPVLATLFLLSYTGILRNVSTVLFSYSTITKLPSNHQHLVWSIDASVPLFGVKFTILFITCLILFVVLIPFNVILLFTRYMMRLRLINQFKPLVDAFQGSYKDRHYYWMAVYILLRNLFFALYVLPTEIRLIISTIALTILLSLFAYTCPNKNTLVNIQELLLLINLTIIYTVSYQCSSTISSAVINVMIGIAFVHFTIMILYHFFTFTCHCDIENLLWAVKAKLIRVCYQLHFTRHPNNDNYLLQIPERSHDYTAYREGLVTDDFVN